MDRLRYLENVRDVTEEGNEVEEVTPNVRVPLKIERRNDVNMRKISSFTL